MKLSYTEPHNINNTQQTCLIENIYYESGDQPFLGKIAVGQVTLNRVTPQNNVCAVIHKPYQFSWVNHRHGIIDKKSEAYLTSVIAAKTVLAGFVYPPVNNALYFHANYVHPKWSKLTYIITIGKHQFYGQTTKIINSRN